MPYGLVVDGGLRDLQDLSYLLSPQDLMALDQVWVGGFGVSKVKVLVPAGSLIPAVTPGPDGTGPGFLWGFLCALVWLRACLYVWVFVFVGRDAAQPGAPFSWGLGLVFRLCPMASW